MTTPAKVGWDCDTEQLEWWNSLDRTVINRNHCCGWLRWSGNIDSHSLFSFWSIYVHLIIERSFSNRVSCSLHLAAIEFVDHLKDVTSSINLNVWCVVWRSLMWIKKIYGPSHVPWGIPPFSVVQLDVKFLIFTRWRRSSKKECIHLLVALQARPSCSALFSDQRDQMIWRNRRILLSLSGDDQLPGDKCARY